MRFRYPYHLAFQLFRGRVTGTGELRGSPHGALTAASRLPTSSLPVIRPLCAITEQRRRRSIVPLDRLIRAAAASSLLLLLTAPPAHALKSDQDQPVYLEADSVELDEQKSESVYKGDVQVQQGSMQILADEVTVHHYPDRRPEHITAIGAPAKYRQEIEGQKQEVHAEALRMEYDAGKDELTLIGQAVLYQGQDTFRNDRIVYDRATAQVKAGTIAQGKERVKIRINPAQHERDNTQGKRAQ
jgi:lipopolysaccharide export system protein LptA